MSRLSDFDLNHALELNLFLLTDTCSSSYYYSKFGFLGSIEELEIVNIDEYYDDRRVYAGRLALLKGKTSFVMTHFSDILKTTHPSDSQLVKLQKCAKDAIISGSTELVEFILNKIGNKQE